MRVFAFGAGGEIAPLTNLAQGSRSYFAQFARCVCEFSSNFLPPPPNPRSPESTKRAGGGKKRGGAGREGLGPGDSDIYTINSPCGNSTQRPLCLPDKGWVSSVCKHAEGSGV